MTLTILTAPVPFPDRSWIPQARHLREYARQRVRRALLGAYGGHHAVTRSLVSGLRALGVRFAYNPLVLPGDSRTVLVLAEAAALRQALAWKSTGRITRLLAGPNLFLRSSDQCGVLADPRVDVCIVPSLPIQRHYEVDLPALIGRVQSWFAGVDAEFWKPIPGRQPISTQGNTRSAIVYWKTEPESFCQEVEEVLGRHGWLIRRLRYGNYRQREYKETLANCRLAVFISRSESQGIALAEAWAMDVPTLVFNPGWRPLEGGGVETASAAPYLTRDCGQAWATLSELDALLTKIETEGLAFSPRNWVLGNMTDAISARLLLHIAGIGVAMRKGKRSA